MFLENKNYSTTYLLNRLDNVEILLDETGTIKEECKFTITNSKFKIQNSKFLSKPEDKFETLLFLPKGEGRKGEGGLRTKGYFKCSYKLNAENNLWYTCDMDGQLVEPAPHQLQQKIIGYIQSLNTSKHDDATNVTELPLITVITVVLNGEKYLEQTIQSVINQTYPNVEYIIIDGGSTDGTLDIIKKYEDQIDYWVSEKDRGIYDAMNKGISVAGGEIVGLINSNDWYEIDTLKLIYNYYVNSDKKSILHGNMNTIKNGQVLYIAKPIDKLFVLKKGMVLNHPTVFMPLYIYKQYGLFSLNYKIASDWELILRLYLNKVNFIYINSVLVNFRLGGVSYIFDERIIREKHQIRKDHGIFEKFDKYFIYDLVKFYIFGNLVSEISLCKQLILLRLKKILSCFI